MKTWHMAMNRDSPATSAQPLPLHLRYLLATRFIMAANPSQYDYLFKVVIIGDSATGKTNCP